MKLAVQQEVYDYLLLFKKGLKKDLLEARERIKRRKNLAKMRGAKRM